MEETIALSNGVRLPRIGFGPGGMGYTPNVMRRPSRALPARVWRRLVALPRMRWSYVHAIAEAIRAGFRLIDYSAAYGDGKAIAEAVRLSGVPREELFLTGRVSNRAQFQGQEAVEREVAGILAGYGVERVDLLMFHWPVTGRYVATWETLCRLYERGLARAVGVANCHPHHLEALEAHGLRPMLNQVEVHPLFTQKSLVAWCQARAIVVEAYTPIARFDDRLMRLPALHHIAEAHGKTPTQVVLRWHLQRGVVPVIRSLNPKRQREDFDVFGFELTETEMATIDGFDIGSRLRYDPDNCDFTIL